ncbi:unnamed protein product [Mytilus coruscus]|uniref:Tesmin/TSO1-like CXC domain-containing protein n=1 Tax=Mytilus coruscus TaxID=42192 RepID=A0A6J8AF39_MYTCO|nr:unnamed protein product [Mytilus coruscus]
MDGLPDIDNFKCKDEILKIPPIVWNFIFRICSTDNEEIAYSVVCAGKDRSGFHGTTIQTVVPKPSQKINIFDDSHLISHLNQTDNKHDISEVKNSRDRKLEKDIIRKLVNPEDKSGLPPVKKQNKFSNMSPSDLNETSAKISEWDEFYTNVTNINWHLRNVSLKTITCLFHAFDKQNYQRIIPYHLADLHTFSPEPVIKHFAAGCFSVSISGKHLYSVALDEAHEMEINVKSKNALNSFSQSSLANLTFYLPYRAKTLHNLKSELQLEREEGLHQREGTMSYVINAEKTVCENMSNLQTSSQFVINCNEKLHHIFTRTETDNEQMDSLTNYRKWIVKYYNQYKANEVHLLFDDPNRNGVSPKDIERTRRNTVVQEPVVVDYDLPSGNHDEADTRVWLHASVTTADQVIVYSPDTDKVEKTVEWYTKGCGCKTGCKTNRCKCKKAQNDNCDGFCGPGCKCVNCFNVPDETEDLEDPVENEQPEVDEIVEEPNQTDYYWLYSNVEI